MAQFRMSEIEHIYHQQVGEIVHECREHRPRDQHASQIVILRGTPGSGKSTFAVLLKIVAEANRFTAQICSADAYFHTRRHGYLWQPECLGFAHGECQQDAQWALWRQVDFVIIDNTNIELREWATYEDMGYVLHPITGRRGAQLHSVIRVNFDCGSIQQAADMNERRSRPIPDDVIQRRLRLYNEHKVEFDTNYEVFPTINTWTQFDE